MCVSLGFTAHTSAPFGVCCAVWWPLMEWFLDSLPIKGLTSSGNTKFSTKGIIQNAIYGEMSASIHCCGVFNHGPWFWSITRCPWMILSYMIIWWWWSFTFPLVHPPFGASGGTIFHLVRPPGANPSYVPWLPSHLFGVALNFSTKVLNWSVRRPDNWWIDKLSKKWWVMETVCGPIADLLVMILMYLSVFNMGFRIFLGSGWSWPWGLTRCVKNHQELSGNHNTWINL